MGYEYIEHTADVQFKARGATLEEAFSSSAEAMTKVVCEDVIAKKTTKEIRINGSDLESLLYNFLEELLILFDSEHFLMNSIEEINIDESNFSLTAKILGDSAEGYEMLTHVKAITYNSMYVRKVDRPSLGHASLGTRAKPLRHDASHLETKNIWEVQVVLDI